MNISGICKADLGLRNWHNYNKPYEFNIVVNDMAEIMKHADAQRCQADGEIGIQSSCTGSFAVLL